MRRVLIVEDDPTLLEVLRAALVQSRWEVATATSLDEALAAWASDRPDVVLTDKNLPGGKITHSEAGIELIRRIRQQDRKVGIVVMTAYGTAESARDSLNLGIDAYLEKPFDNLFAVIERLARLADRAHSPQGTSSGHLTVLVGARGPRQQQIGDALSGGDRVVYVDDSSALRDSATSHHADVVILDGASFPEEITALVVAVKTRVHGAACVVLSQDLPFADVKRLIELNVKALIDRPPGNERFAIELRAALERLRKL
jgi:two-component system response regulator (stage 0 sporulation protein F)